MEVVTLVPYRAGEPKREWLWDHTKFYLESLSFPIFLGDSEGPWARAAALNNASKEAGDWDIALIADADTVPDEDSIFRAVDWVTSTHGAARPHMERWMLSESGTIEFLRRGPSGLVHPAHFDKQYQGGGLIVVHRDAWEAVGGFDERFVGWGHEDTAFNLRILRRSRWDRLPGDAWHLWHPRPKGGASMNNQGLYNRFLRGYRDDIENWARDKGLTNPQEIF